MAWERLIDVVQALAPGADLDLRPPLPPDNLNRLLESIPEAAHGPLRRIYARGNGQGSGASFGLLSGLYWRSLGDLANSWAMACDLDEEYKNMTPGVPCVPADAMLPVWQSDGWISVAHDYGNLEVGIDMTPGPSGAVGQVVNWGPEYEDHFVLASDLDALADAIATEVEAGNYLMESEDGSTPYPRLLVASPGVSAIRHVLGSEPAGQERPARHLP